MCARENSRKKRERNEQETLDHTDGVDGDFYLVYIDILPLKKKLGGYDFFLNVFEKKLIF